MKRWRLLGLLLLVAPVVYGALLLAALGHHVTETRQDLAAAQGRLAALEAERAQLIRERDAARAEAQAALRTAGALSGAGREALAAGAAVAGSATVTAVLAPGRYLARVLPATPEVVLRFAVPQRLRPGQTLAFTGHVVAEAGPRGLPMVDVDAAPGGPLQ